MKLTSKAITEIKKNTRLKNRLALELEKSGYTVERWISENEENGMLTTAKSVQLILEETELNSSEVLEDSTEKEPKETLS